MGRGSVLLIHWTHCIFTTKDKEEDLNILPLRISNLFSGEYGFLNIGYIPDNILYYNIFEPAAKQRE